jgi:hypothetical protein
VADLVADFKQLRLYGMAACYAEGLEHGQSAMTTATALLTQLLQAETTDRATRSIRYQMHVARFPVHRDLAGFDFDQARSTVGRSRASPRPPSPRRRRISC